MIVWVFKITGLFQLSCVESCSYYFLFYPFDVSRAQGDMIWFHSLYWKFVTLLSLFLDSLLEICQFYHFKKKTAVFSFVFSFFPFSISLILTTLQLIKFLHSASVGLFCSSFLESWDRSWNYSCGIFFSNLITNYKFSS